MQQVCKSLNHKSILNCEKAYLTPTCNNGDGCRSKRYSCRKRPCASCLVWWFYSLTKMKLVSSSPFAMFFWGYILRYYDLHTRSWVLLLLCCKTTFEVLVLDTFMHGLNGMLNPECTWKRIKHMNIWLEGIIVVSGLGLVKIENSVL